MHVPFLPTLCCLVLLLAGCHAQAAASTAVSSNAHASLAGHASPTSADAREPRAVDTGSSARRALGPPADSPPQISLSATYVTFEMQSPSSHAPDAAIYVTNKGGSLLNVNVEMLPRPAWLTVTPTSFQVPAGASLRLTVRVITDQLPPSLLDEPLVQLVDLQHNAPAGPLALAVVVEVTGHSLKQDGGVFGAGFATGAAVCLVLAAAAVYLWRRFGERVRATCCGCFKRGSGMRSGAAMSSSGAGGTRPSTRGFQKVGADSNGRRGSVGSAGDVESGSVGSRSRSGSVHPLPEPAVSGLPATQASQPGRGGLQRQAQEQALAGGSDVTFPPRASSAGAALGSQGSARGSGFSLVPNPVLRTEEFETSWSSFATCDIWGANARVPLPDDAHIEAALAAHSVLCIASGVLGDVHKFYFYGKDPAGLLYLVELSLITAPANRFSALFKCESQQHGVLFADEIKAALLPFTVS